MIGVCRLDPETDRRLLKREHSRIFTRQNTIHVRFLPIFSVAPKSTREEMAARSS
jgi:hypothetical protein